MSKAQARRLGDRAEGAVIELLPWLRYVSDETAEHYDAVARDSTDVVNEGDPVEIKSVAVRLASGSPGRFNVRRTQHEALLEVGGWYLFVVCTPNQERGVLAYEFVPAAVVDEELIPTAGAGDDSVSLWWDGGDGREEYRQITWTAVFDKEDVLDE